MFEFWFEVVLEFLPFIIAVGVFGFTYLKKNKTVQSNWEKFKSMVDDEFREVNDSVPVHEGEQFGMVHENTRDHRIFEQASREAMYSESRPTRLSDQKVRMQRSSLKRRVTSETTRSNKPEVLIKNTAFRDKNRVRDALLYGEILSTPVSKIKK